MNNRSVCLALACITLVLIGTAKGFEGKTFLSRTSNDAKTTDDFVAPSDGSVFLGSTTTYSDWLKLDPEKTWLNVQILNVESLTKTKGDVEPPADSKSATAKDSSNEESDKANSEIDAENVPESTPLDKDSEKSKTEEKASKNVALSDETSAKEEKTKGDSESEKVEETSKENVGVDGAKTNKDDVDDSKQESKKTNDDSADPSEGIDKEIDEAAPCSIKRPELKLRGERVEGAYVMQTRQRAVLVWNGRVNDQGEELLIVESDEYANVVGNDVVLGILPLPGKPLEITRVGDEFTPLRDATIQKIQKTTNPGSVTPDNLIENQRKIPSYCVLVVECDNIVAFEDVVEAKLKETLGDARLVLSDSERETLKRCSERGIRYFALDVAEIVGDEEIRKAPLAFRFKSDKLFYPMQIAQIGAQDFLVLDVVVLTPKKLVQTPGSWLDSKGQKESNVFVGSMGNMAVVFTLDELKKLAPVVAKFCEETKISEFQTRDLIIRGRADRFSGDLTMTNKEK